MNSLGRIFRINSFGESHGRCVGVVVDGCPAGLSLDVADIQPELDRRRPGGNPAATARREPDRVEILSGTADGFTTGAPICLMTSNRDYDDSAYEVTRFTPRPGHADYTAWLKYGGFNDWRGGGMFSGRLTAAFVMAGAIAKKLLERLGVDILAHTIEIGGIAAGTNSIEKIKKAGSNPLRCANVSAARKMSALIARTKAAGDSLGGIIEGIALGVPAGLGEPPFANLDGDLARALLAIPAVKGVEFGDGFAAARLKGSQNNDPFAIENGKVITTTNHAGGILGGISTGMPIIVRVAVKPVASIAIEQDTVDLKKMKPARLRVGGRHDVCIVPRAVPVVGAMMAVTLCDFAMMAGLIPPVLEKG